MADLTTPIDISSLNKYRERNVNNILNLSQGDVAIALQHMTLYPGIEHSVALEQFINASISKKYTGAFTADKALGTITERVLTVKPIVAETKDEPERYRNNYLIAVAGGLDAKNNPFEKWIIEQAIRQASIDLLGVLWTAKYDADVAKLDIKDAFDGVQTIIEAGITASDIAAGKGNYTAETGAYTASNIESRLLAQYRKLSPYTQMAGAKIYISYNMLQMYDDAYKASHDAPPGVDTSGQTILEGTQKKAILIGLPCIPDQTVMITLQSNLRYGTDNLANMKKMTFFESGNPYLVTAAMKYIFGVQFHTFHKDFFQYAKVA